MPRFYNPTTGRFITSPWFNACQNYPTWQYAPEDPENCDIPAEQIAIVNRENETKFPTTLFSVWHRPRVPVRPSKEPLPTVKIPPVENVVEPAESETANLNAPEPPKRRGRPRKEKAS